MVAPVGAAAFREITPVRPGAPTPARLCPPRQLDLLLLTETVQFDVKRQFDCLAFAVINAPPEVF